MENREERESRRKAGKRRRIKRTALILCAVLVLILSAYGAGSAYAKYVFNRSRSDVVKVKEFYFTSDLLGKTTENKAYTLNPGKTEFSFELRNSADALRVSTADIEYTVTVSPDEDVTVTDEKKGKLSVATDGSAVSHTVTLSGLELGKTYTVTVVGEAGFKETLKATFTTKAEEQVLFKHLDASDPHFVVLTVWTKDKSGDVTITYPAGLIPDNTQMLGAKTAAAGNTETYTDEISFSEEYASQTYRFFKNSSSSFNDGQFIVTLGETEAQSGTP